VSLSLQSIQTVAEDVFIRAVSASHSGNAAQCGLCLTALAKIALLTYLLTAMSLESNGHSMVFFVVVWNRDVAVVQRLFRAGQVDVEFDHDRRVGGAQSRSTSRPHTL